MASLPLWLMRFSPMNSLHKHRTTTGCIHLYSICRLLCNARGYFLKDGRYDPKSYQLLQILLNTRKLCYRKDDRAMRYTSRSWAVAEIWPFEIFQDGGDRHLEFVRIENSAIRSAVPENSTLEQSMKWIGSPVAEIWPFAHVGGHMEPHFGQKGRS